MPRRLTTARGLVGLAMLAAACGGKKDDAPSAEPSSASKVGTAAAADPGPALEPVPMGKADLAGYAYSLGRASRTFQPIKAAEKRGDWKRVEAVARATIVADPGHLSAHWRLALALAHQRRYAEVTAPLSAAVGGDWMRWGARSLRTPALSAYLATPEGARYRSLADRYRDLYRRVLTDGMLVVGRRGKPWLPKGTGDTLINHRSEIYAYDVDKGRYLRVSRTNASLVGFIHAPRVPRLAYLSYRRVWVPSDADKKAGRVPYIRKLHIGEVHLDGLAMGPREAVLTDVASVSLWYARDGKGRLRLYARARFVHKGVASPPTLLRIDLKTGAARPLGAAAAQGTEALVVSYNAASVHRTKVEGVHADWGDDESAGALRLANTQKTVTFPAGESAWRDSLTWSTGRRRIAVSTRARAPCSNDPAERTVKLYVIDAATGKLRPVAVGEGDFAAQWIDDRRLAYVDTAPEEPAVRILDVVSGSEIARLETRGGLGTRLLPTKPPCPLEPNPDEQDVDEEVDEVAKPPPIPAKRKSGEGSSSAAPSSTGRKLDSRAEPGENAR